MNKSEFITELLGAIGARASTAAEDAKLADLVTWDSMSQIAALAFVEDRYRVQLRPAELSQCKTIGDLIALVERKAS